MPGNEPAKAAITNLRHRLLAEHTGVNTEVLAEMLDSCAMMRDAMLMQLSLMNDGTLVQANSQNKVSRQRRNPFDFRPKSSIAVVTESHRI